MQHASHMDRRCVRRYALSGVWKSGCARALSDSERCRFILRKSISARTVRPVCLDRHLRVGLSGRHFVQLPKRGAHTIELNLEPSAGASRFDETHYGLASKIVPAFVDKLLAPDG